MTALRALQWLCIAAALLVASLVYAVAVWRAVFPAANKARRKKLLQQLGVQQDDRTIVGLFHPYWRVSTSPAMKRIAEAQASQQCWRWRRACPLDSYSLSTARRAQGHMRCLYWRRRRAKGRDNIESQGKSTSDSSYDIVRCLTSTAGSFLN